VTVKGNLMPRSEIYRKDRLKYRNAESARRDAKLPRVSGEEFNRLRTPENRLESLNYGSDRKKVCLNCGYVGDNLAAHVWRCPRRPCKARVYKDEWDFNRTTSLYSESLSQKHRDIRKEKGYRAPILTAKQHEEITRKSAATRTGMKLRAPALAERRGRRLPPRPHLQKVPDTAIQRVMALNLPIAEGARRAGLSQTGYYRRIQKLGWTASEVRAQRGLITRYLFDLRTWSRQQAEPPTLDRILERHSSGLRGNEAGKFRPFTPYISHLEAELLAKLSVVGEMRGKRDSSAVVTLAAKVFQRARAVPASSPLAKKKSTRGPAPTKRALFEQGLLLREVGKSWGVIAKTLDPDGFAKNQRAASDRLRVGIEALRKKKASSVSD
jgi:hypothetical protein